MNDMQKVLFANIGWMIHYEGLTSSDTIRGGGYQPENQKHEAYNFKPYRGRCYGYVQPQGKGINISRINGENLDSFESVEDVLVIWTAIRPGVTGTYIVGWYKHATVYKFVPDRKLSYRNGYGFNIEAKVENCVLLPVDERVSIVPRGKGGMGQSNVWYADSDEGIEFRKEVQKTIRKHERRLQAGQSKAKGRKVIVSAEARQQVERIAIECVTRYYEEREYVVESVEKDNCGQNLNAKTKEGVSLRIEVKGLAGDDVSVRLTPNEYSTMKREDYDYRLCVVTNAMKSPCLTVFLYDGKGWVCEDDSTMLLNFQECVAAVAYVV